MALGNPNENPPTPDLKFLTREEIGQMDFDDAYSIWLSNHQNLLQFIDEYKDAIPFFGLHGIPAQNLEALKSEFDYFTGDVVYLGRKHADPAILLGVLYSMAKIAGYYGFKCRDAEFRGKGGILLFDFTDFLRKVTAKTYPSFEATRILYVETMGRPADDGLIPDSAEVKRSLFSPNPCAPRSDRSLDENPWRGRGSADYAEFQKRLKGIYLYEEAECFEARRMGDLPDTRSDLLASRFYEQHVVDFCMKKLEIY